MNATWILVRYQGALTKNFWWEWGFIESVKKAKFMMKKFGIMLNEVLKICEKWISTGYKSQCKNNNK